MLQRMDRPRARWRDLSVPVGAPTLLFSKLPFGRAAPTAADPKESCRRVVSEDASETVLQVALGNQKVGPKVSFP